MIKTSRVCRALGAALATSAIALATLTACSSQSGSGSGGSGLSSLYKKWDQTLDQQANEADKACDSPISADCYNEMQAVATILRQIRADIPSSSDQSTFAGLTTALDAADSTLTKFSNQCLPGSSDENCLIQLTQISQAITKVLNQLSA